MKTDYIHAETSRSYLESYENRTLGGFLLVNGMVMFYVLLAQLWYPALCSKPCLDIAVKVFVDVINIYNQFGFKWKRLLSCG